MLLLAVLAPQLSPKADFARCVAALRSNSGYAVRLQSTTVGPVATLVTSGTLAVRSKDWASLDVRTPADAGHGALDWTCEVHGKTLRAYDSSRRAYIEQKFAQALPAAAGLAAQFGSMIPDGLQRFLSPEVLEKFFSRFESLKGWQRTSRNDLVVWSYKNARGQVRFTFAKGSGRLVEWQIAEQSSTTWKIEYPVVSTIPRLAIPADAILVESFRLPPPRPTVKDQAARHEVNLCFDAYERAFRFHTTVTVDGAKSEIWRNGGMVEEVGRTGGWKWSRGTLTLWPKSGGVYRGETRLSRIRSYLAQLHMDIEPLAVSALGDTNYAASLFTSDYEAKQIGSVVLGNEACALLQLTGPAVRIDLMVDAHGYIRRIDSTAFDRYGKRMSETVRQLSYSELGTPAAPPRGAVKPLPKLLPPPKPPPENKQGA